MRDPLIDIFFELRSIPPFDGLDSDTILAAARMCRPVEYMGLQKIVGCEHPLNFAYVFRAGTTNVCNPEAIPCLWGLREILEDKAPVEDVCAGPEGLIAYRIPKSQILVFMREVPQLLLGQIRRESNTQKGPAK